ncbi:MAG TPA: hypothetical protein VMU02_12025 [bacterium]|nr:hypothetical protein [bacterium]
MNTDSKVIHDLWRATAACEIDKIPRNRTKSVETCEEAKQQSELHGYNPCVHCMPEVHKD